MMEKEKVFSDVQLFLDQSGIAVSSTDTQRPWGGFFVIDETHSQNFLDLFFPEINKDEILKGRISPKILVVAPNKKLSWQYHSRRSEIWKLVKGEAGVVTSNTDIESKNQVLSIGEIITLQNGQRHRLVGLNEWGIVAEIWIHTDANHPSNEDDIVRLQDDFGR